VNIKNLPYIFFYTYGTQVRKAIFMQCSGDQIKEDHVEMTGDTGNACKIYSGNLKGGYYFRVLDIEERYS
jgi:hypothetical protein